MLTLFLSQIIIIFLLIFLFINNPLIIGVILIIIRLIISLSIYLLSTASWISYILIIIFLSGIIIIFIYMSRLATNESIKIKSIILIIFVISRPLVVIIYYFNINNYKNMNNLRILIETKISPSFKLIYKTYRHLSYEISIIIILYLLIVLIAAVKIALINYLPLRRKN